MGVVRRRRVSTGTMEQQRKRHLQRQARQDALTRLKAGDTVSIMAYTGKGYARFTVRPVDASCAFDPPSGSQVLVLMEGKVQVADYSDKDGQKVFGRGTYYVRSDKLLGVVVDDAGGAK